MKNIQIYLLLTLLSFSPCCTTEQENAGNADKSEEAEKREQKIISRDLEAIRKDGKLKALTTYSSTSYFLYRGQPMGFEYELLKRFADFLDLELEIHISQDIDSLLQEVNTDSIDIVAHGITITSERKEVVNFTDYLYLTHQVLVQRKPENWRNMKWSAIQKHLVHDAIELIGDTVSVRKNSSYSHRLGNLEDEIGGEIIVDPVEGNVSTDRIIKKVVDGEIEYTIADNNIASINKSYYPALNIEVPISFSQRIAWAVSPKSPTLLEAANKWLRQMKKQTDYYVIYNKYFKNTRSFRKRIKSDFFSLNNNKISKYDAYIKTYAEQINWDWRLLASLVYQESRFKPEAQSWARAKGLMQLMPATAKELGVSNRMNPEENLRGGTKYLQQMWERFDEVKDSLQRIKFAMAAYNCGFHHVKDAQRLAEKNGHDPTTWDEHVGKMILKLSYPKVYNQPFIKYGYVRGIEPYTYVDQIFKRYHHYRKFIEV